jgi:hypothetical protein
MRSVRLFYYDEASRVTITQIAPYSVYNNRYFIILKENGNRKKTTDTGRNFSFFGGEVPHRQLITE